MSRLLNSAEAADLLGVPESWVLSSARAQRIPSVKLGHYVRFDEAELREWWRRRQRGPRSKAS